MHSKFFFKFIVGEEKGNFLGEILIKLKSKQRNFFPCQLVVGEEEGKILSEFLN